MSAEDREVVRAEAVAELRRHLAWLDDAGVREIPERPVLPGPRPVQPAPAPELQPSRDQGGPPARGGPAASPGAPSAVARVGDVRPSARAPAAPGAGQYGLADRGCGSPGLLEIRQELGECQRCKLGRGRTRLVFGVGSPQAELMFVGEGPGEDEDRQGEPFVGRAGQLLTKMIEAMGYRRTDVYIANVVKCRPPGNRDPQPDEISACAPWLDRQLELIRPRVIVTLGNFATKLLLDTKAGITRLRGQQFPFERAGIDAVLIPTLHPSAVLRSGGKALAEARADFVHVKRALARAAR